MTAAASPLPSPPTAAPPRTDWIALIQQIQDGKTPPPPPEIVQLFSAATTAALVGGSLGAFVAYRHAKVARLDYRSAMGALGHNMFLTGARFATLVTTFSASKIACEALGDMGSALNTAVAGSATGALFGATRGAFKGCAAGGALGFALGYAAAAAANAAQSAANAAQSSANAAQSAANAAQSAAIATQSANEGGKR